MSAELDNYSFDIQHLLISYMLADADAFIQCQNIVKDEYFDDGLRSSVRFITEYSTTYKALPQLVQVKASTGVDFNDLATSPQHNTWFLETIEKFARQRALEIAVMDGADLVMEGRGGELEKRVRDALSITLLQNIGTDYFADPAGRIKDALDNSACYSTGWKTLDDKLFGGFVKGGLNIFAAGPGVGKSLWLQNISLNWASMGKHVVYISLELPEHLIANRLDAMVAGCSTREIIKNVNDVAMKVKRRGQKDGGSIQIKRLPESTTNVNHIRAYLKEYEIKTGRKPDALVVDYLDIMAPCQKVDMSNLFIKDKYVSEELRALLCEYDIIGATASQLNRGSIEASEFDQSHIAGGLTKINTADCAFAILASPSMKDAGRMQLQFLKTRSSSGVGQKIEFKYCPITMLISDPDEDEDAQKPASSGDLRSEFRAKTTARQEIASVVDSIADNEATVKKAGTDVMALMSSMRNKTNV